MCPIFKICDPSIPSNYRPVSLLNTAEKVFERNVYNHVFFYLRGTNFFTPFQSGFLPGDSTVNQTLTLYHNICRALDNGHEYRMIFFDVSEAFDKVWHKGLLFKLYHKGVRGRLLKWFTEYLSNRQQRVVLNGSVSKLSVLKAGVPQGSILGPLLFLAHLSTTCSG